MKHKTILKDVIKDLIKQATNPYTEKSHYYTVKVLKRALRKIQDLEDTVESYRFSLDEDVTA